MILLEIKINKFDFLNTFRRRINNNNVNKKWFKLIIKIVIKFILLTTLEIFTILILSKDFIFISFLISKIIVIIFIIDIILFNEITIYDNNSSIKNLINEFFIL